MKILAFLVSCFKFLGGHFFEEIPKQKAIANKFSKAALPINKSCLCTANAMITTSATDTAATLEYLRIRSKKLSTISPHCTPPSKFCNYAFSMGLASFLASRIKKRFN